jgi:hypothetical protein
MSNVGIFITTIKEETHWPNEDDAIVRHMVAALRHYRSQRWYFSEKSGTFNTVASQAAYARGTPGYPADLMDIEDLRVVQGASEWELERISFDEMRQRQFASNVPANVPDAYCMWADTLILNPTPSGILVMNVDYILDSSIDTASGDPIDGSDNTHTNDYFTRGEELLRTRTIYAMALGRAEDTEFALSMKALNDEAERSLRGETVTRQVGSTLESQGYF